MNKEEVEKYLKLGYESLNERCNINIIENKQKYFIAYLNSYIKLLSNNPDSVEEGQKEILEEILLKYYEIIEKVGKGE